jgi:predicted transposase/invertase (TIGR01784 family)
MAIELHNPHDSLFKRALANLEVAKDLLQAHLAPEIVKRIDWNSIQLTNKSFVDEKLAHLHSDVVYQCKIDGKEAYIYCLIEAQTTPDPLFPFRILRYNIALMEQHINQGHKRLPVIINLCLYSGEQTPYPYSLDIYDCFQDPEMARAKMFKPLELVDLNAQSQEELSQHGKADLLELLLKQSLHKDFLNWIKEQPELVLKLLERIYGISGIRYILATDAKHTPEELLEAIIKIAPNKKEDIMTAAQQLIDRGIQQGIQQGMQEGIQQGLQYEKLEIAKNMLWNLHLGLDIVQQATGLSKEELERLSKPAFGHNS